MMDDETMADDVGALIRAAELAPRRTVLMLVEVFSGALVTANRERDEARAEIAAAVAAEREACARVCDEVSDAAEREIEGDWHDWPQTYGESCGAARCAEAIRTRRGE